MEIAILIEDVDEYRGKRLELYEYKWGNSKNGILKAMSWISEYKDKTIDYLYFGNEFCEYRIPTIEQLRKIVELCNKEGVGLVLVTPVVTDYGVEKIAQLLEYIVCNNIELDIVVNDVGILELIRQRSFNCNIIMGRVFDKTSHDSRAKMDELENYYGLNGKCFAMTPGIVSNQSIQAYRDYKISRYEFDLPKIGLLLPANMNLSLYWPYSYLTTGRVCLLHSTELEGKNKFLICNKVCGQPCKHLQIEKRKPINGFSIENGERVTDLFLFQRGNTIFYINNREEQNQFIKQFNRLIIQL